MLYGVRAMKRHGYLDVTEFGQSTNDRVRNVADLIRKADELYNFSDFDELVVNLELTPATSSLPATDMDMILCPEYDDTIAEISRAGESPVETDEIGICTKGTRIIDHVRKYRYLLDDESDLLQLLLFSRRVVFVRNIHHRHWWFEHLVPWVHFVPVGPDDDVERVKFLVLSDPVLESAIISNAIRFARTWLTRCAAVRHHIIFDHSTAIKRDQKHTEPSSVSRFFRRTAFGRRKM